MIARIHAIVRRSQGHAQSVIEIGDLVLNLDTKTVEAFGSRVHFTVKEYQMLELLCLHKDRPVTKEMFLNHLYGGMDEPQVKIIDVFICKLRKKLANATRLEALPDVPTVAEFVPGYEASVWSGVGAPKNTAADIVENLNKEINAGHRLAGARPRGEELVFLGER